MRIEVHNCSCSREVSYLEDLSFRKGKVFMRIEVHNCSCSREV